MFKIIEIREECDKTFKHHFASMKMQKKKTFSSSPFKWLILRLPPGYLTLENEQENTQLMNIYIHKKYTILKPEELNEKSK
jgi:hypothetical protein